MFCAAYGQETIPRPSDFAKQAEAVRLPKTVQVAEGESVEARPIPEITISFPQVRKSGTVTSRINFEGPTAPKGYQVGTLPIYLELSTTAEYEGRLRVCINYSPSLFPEQGADLRVLRKEKEGWSDESRTLDREKHVICSEMASLGSLLMAIRTVEGLYEDLALTIRQMPSQELQKTLAEPLLKSRDAAQKGEQEAFRTEIEKLRKIMNAQAAETLPSELKEWTEYFVRRLEARVLK